MRVPAQAVGFVAVMLSAMLLSQAFGQDVAESAPATPAHSYLKPIAEWAVALLELAGVVTVVVGSVASGLEFLGGWWRRLGFENTFDAFRSRLSRSILLGLEFLIGADIINTVAVDHSFASVGTLALVVLIRTFLSFTLELEITGRWPWQQAEGSG